MFALRSIAAPVQRQCFRAAPRAAVSLSLQVRHHNPMSPYALSDSVLTLDIAEQVLLVAGLYRQVHWPEGRAGRP